MNTNNQQNTFSNPIVWVLAVALVVVGGLYLFNRDSGNPDNEIENTLTQQIDNKDRSFSMKQECQEAGEKLYQDDVKSLGKNNIFVPQYTYSESLNTCLYYGGYIQPDWINKWVKDVYTNEEIISYMAQGDQVILGSTCPTCMTNEAFEQKKSELFGE